MIKRILATLALLSISTPAFAAFKDVPVGHRYRNAIWFAESQGMVQGFKGGWFKPEQPMLRGEFLSIVMGLRPWGIDEPECDDLAWIPMDVSQHDWFFPAVQKASKYGIIRGFEDSTFKPHGILQMADAAVILARAYGLITVEEQMELEQTTTWYWPAAQALAARGILKSADIMPNKAITRGEAVAMIVALEKASPKK